MMPVQTFLLCSHGANGGRVGHFLTDRRPRRRQQIVTWLKRQVRGIEVPGHSGYIPVPAR